MNQIVTEGIILSRTDYGEADRIITLLTPDHGKLRLMAKGVRRVKSKLAGGIELFSVSTITFVKGRGEIGTLVSTRLLRHYAHIVQDLDRTMLGYELIKQLDKATEDHPEQAYFALLQRAFAALDDTAVPLVITRLWFTAQLLRIGGHAPNLTTDRAGHKLEADQAYIFDAESMCFATTPGGAGNYQANHIKFLRLAFGGHAPQVLAGVQSAESLAREVTPMVEAAVRTR